MLEIGSWGGESAILRAEAAKQTLGEKYRQPPSIICVDPWTSYLSLNRNLHLQTMIKGAAIDKIFSIFPS
jgi:hypothetical protein